MNPRRVPCLAAASLFAAFSLGGLSSTRATLIVYEGFDYGGFQTVLFGLGGSTDFGLQGGWTDTGNNSTIVEYLPDGLTFSDLQVTAGLAQMNGVRTGSGDRIAAASRQLDVDAQFGTLWGSYLFRTSSDLATRSVGSLLQGNANNVSDNTAYFSFAHNEFNDDVGGVRVSNTVGGGAAKATLGALPSLGLTYLFVFRMDNIGAVSGSSQTGSVWMLSEEQYDSFKAGGIDEAELNTANLGFFANEVMQRATFTTAGLTNPGTFDATDFLRMFAFSGNEFITQMDEIKFSNGSMNEAIIGIPEPSALTAMIGGLSVLLGMQRARRRSNS